MTLVAAEQLICAETAEQKFALCGTTGSEEKGHGYGDVHFGVVRIDKAFTLVFVQRRFGEGYVDSDEIEDDLDSDDGSSGESGERD